MPAMAALRCARIRNGRGNCCARLWPAAHLLVQGLVAARSELRGAPSAQTGVLVVPDTGRWTIDRDVVASVAVVVAGQGRVAGGAKLRLGAGAAGEANKPGAVRGAIDGKIDFPVAV